MVLDVTTALMVVAEVAVLAVDVDCDFTGVDPVVPVLSLAVVSTVAVFVVDKRVTETVEIDVGTLPVDDWDVTVVVTVVDETETADVNVAVDDCRLHAAGGV